MSNAAITTERLEGWLRRFYDLITKNQAELTKLDSAIGDADHGINMARGMGAVTQKLDGMHPADVAGLLKTVAMTLITSVGGASGPLYGTFFLRFGQAVGSANVLDLANFATGLRAGLAGIVERGKAVTGDKTMVDALSPALHEMDAVIKDGGDLAGAVTAARDAAAAGRDATLALVARKGRASYLGERSAGHLDAVARDAEAALNAKAAQLGQTPAGVVVPSPPHPKIVTEATVVDPDGIHARPAALIVGTIASLDARITVATERSAPVSARSPTALMSLGTRAGDALRIEADGADAAAAVDRILTLVNEGFGELDSTTSGSPAGFDSSGRRDVLEAPLGVSPGRVVGPAMGMPDLIAEPDPKAGIPEAERPAAIQRLATATADVAKQLRSRITAAGVVGELLEATAAMALDPELLTDASRRVRDQGLSPERAIWEAFGTAANTIRTAGPRQAERVTDLYDVRNRIVSTLIGRTSPGVPNPGHPYALVAVDLAPADAAGLDATGCLAIVTEKGGPTSHAAIIARSLGIPAVVGAPGASAIPDGTLLLVDGTTGEPTIDQQATATAQRAQRDALVGLGGTADGHRVPLLANIGSDHDANAALDCGAEGVGLYRTELCFLDRAEPPSVAEQVVAYRSVFSAFAGRRVVVRTLDAGSDKPLPFLAHAVEPNPALGVRGFRTAASCPVVLRDQLSAIKEAAVAESAEVWVMAPMITTVEEARSFAQAARAAGLPIIAS